MPNANVPAGKLSETPTKALFVKIELIINIQIMRMLKYQDLYYNHFIVFDDNGFHLNDSQMAVSISLDNLNLQ